MKLIFFKLFINSINSIVYFSIFSFLLLAILPLNPEFMGSSLDPSWKAVIDYAMQELDFGKDVIFTFGPQGSYWLPQYYYNPDTYLAAWFISSLLIIVLFSILFVTTIKLDIYQKSISLLAIMTGILIQGNFIWFMLPILFVLNYF